MADNHTQPLKPPHTNQNPVNPPVDGKPPKTPLQTLTENLPTIAETLRKYRIIYLGYVASLTIFIATSVLEVFEAPFLTNIIDAYNLDKIIFATMLFSVSMIIYFVREQEQLKLEQSLQEQKKVKEGVWLAEQEIRNQIILINQATHLAEKHGELTPELIRIIRENTRKMEHQLETLQKPEVDPRSFLPHPEPTIGGGGVPTPSRSTSSPAKRTRKNA